MWPNSQLPGNKFIFCAVYGNKVVAINENFEIFRSTRVIFLENNFFKKSRFRESRIILWNFGRNTLGKKYCKFLFHISKKFKHAIFTKYRNLDHKRLDSSFWWITKSGEHTKHVLPKRYCYLKSWKNHAWEYWSVKQQYCYIVITIQLCILNRS